MLLIVEHSRCIHITIFLQDSIYQSCSNLGLNMVILPFFGWICGEIQALLPCWLSQLVIFTKSLFIIGQQLQFCCLVPRFHNFLSSAHMTLSVQSVRSVGFGMLIEHISCGANLMLIGPQENVSLIPPKKAQSAPMWKIFSTLSI